MTGVQGVLMWLIIAMVLAFFEAITIQLVSIWFAIGALPAMLVAGLGGELWLQLLVFLITSILVLILGRPFVKGKLETTKQATNADRVIGMTGLVLEDIDNLANSGRVSANGLEWTAVTADNDVILPRDSKVLVLKIDGVKLVVKPL